MRLSRLKLAGFKTFVDPTTVLSPGQLVGVVGPNGCGKSNIIDAVRWVLGETRASALRGASMQDVIFNGSTTRKAVSRASVELVFDNADGKAAGQWSQYAEIAVRRVLDRSGDSSYYINNMLVRRKDVVDLFLGTGLGPRAYAIIEQGMISRIIEARPEEVRGFLEEAAGVTKYRERRRETEGRLSDAGENLLRLDDICLELGDRITRLEGQAEIAERYRRMHHDHAQKQQLLWLLKRNEARAESERVVQALEGVSRQMESDSTRLGELTAAIDTARGVHQGASEAVQVAQNDFFNASAEVSRLEGERQHLADNRRRLAARLEQLDGEHTHWATRQAQLIEEQARWQALLEAADLRLAQAEARHEAAGDRVPEAESHFRTAEATAAAARRELAQTEQQARVEETRSASARRALDALQVRQARLSAEEGQIAAPPETEVARCEMQLAAAEEALHQLIEENETLQAAMPAQQAALKRAADEEREIQRRLTTAQARHEALVQLQRKVKQQGALGDWLRRRGLEGATALWQQLEVAAGWESAVEAVLRERLAALPESALADLSAWRAEPPPTTLAVMRASTTPHDDAAPLAGATPLIAHLRCDASLHGTLAHWLAGVYAVDDLAGWADRRDTLAPGQVLVAPDGQCLTRDCFIHYVADARTHGVIEREREIHELDALLDTLATGHETAQAAVTEADRLFALTQARATDLRRQQQDRQGAVHQAQVALLKQTQARQRAEEQQARIAGDLSEIQRALAVEQEHLSVAGSELSRCEALVEVLRERLEHANTVRADREAAYREAQNQLQSLARDMSEAGFSQRECGGKLDDIARNLALAAEQLARIAQERAARAAEHDATDPLAGEAALQAALEQRASRETALSARRDQLAEAAAQLKALEEDRLRVEQAAAPLRDQVAELRLARQAAELAQAQHQSRLDEVEADEALLTPLLADVRETALQRDVASLARQIDALGAVNLAALDELKTASERKGYLDAQHADLTEAIATLEDAIRRIDRETREQLQVTYDTVSAQFSTLFPQLFGGGQARLVLTGDEILDAGIQIVAQPPGKKNASIHLLSGGEKALTAIALVFSLFQLNPAPFCMLDEVDAPLDDTNTGRFCEMVKRMASQTQFLFISHNKITMEIAQQLVGVTMQEQGVSRIVEVDMEEALRMADAAPA
ncbi:chromosome segregation protein SMC [Denitromonas ohlonensis]|uniref:Chromosome partition protein Smc n=2 Tax=Denitromonas TaxID=139331 RepID=A0A557SJ97_9RHOO|nr:chromosome segregation protein SMC [Denitromonas ohlonensis]TVO69401.1 chromosome segregation protein SMC [Denitromonas ohlonensis]TVO77501.1 chromosome segregation protein SMC [Denitromonas ohlonensis]